MKTIFYAACLFFAFATVGKAQTVREETQDDFDDKLQQEPPRDGQRTLERVAAPSTPAQQNAKAQAEAEEKRKKEIERATGQSADNPAKNNTIIPQPRLSEPVSKPLKSN